MTQVLIAGANGFLGKTLVQACVRQGWTVDAVINTSREGLDPVIRNIVSVDNLQQYTDDYAYVFNVAAFIPYGAYNTPDERLINSNVVLNLRLHQAFPKAKLVYASSVSVYGNNIGIMNEQSDCMSPTLYGLSKLSGELVAMHHEQYAVVRFSSLYGRGMYAGTFIPRVVQGAKNTKAITLLGTGERKQNYLHILDAAEYCIHAALNAPNGIYLGVNTQAYSNREVAEIVAANIADCGIHYTGNDSSPSFLYDNTHTLSSLRFMPRIPLEQGIKELINE